MKVKDVEKSIKKLRKQGYADEQIAKSFINLYVTDQVNYEQCKALLNVLNFHFNEEIDKLSDENRKSILKQML